MAQWIERSRRKVSGGLVVKRGKKEKQQRGRDFLPAHVGTRKIKLKRTRGGGRKLIVLSVEKANVSMPDGSNKITKIISVVRNPADTQFTRRNIITKGAILQTEMGEVQVTSRPGQEGIINAVPVESKKKNG